MSRENVTVGLAGCGGAWLVVTDARTAAASAKATPPTVDWIRMAADSTGFEGLHSGAKAGYSHGSLAMRVRFAGDC